MSGENTKPAVKGRHTRRSLDTSRTKRVKKKTIEEDVAELVSEKLTHYVNITKREDMFDPSGRGIYATNTKMANYDFAYRVLERTELQNLSPKNKKNASITPDLVTNSRRVTLVQEVCRLSEYASQIYDSTPVSYLNEVHRYRPHTKVNNETRTGKVQNYSRNVHAALHTKTYVDYYASEGLDTGNKEKASRLQKLRMRAPTPSTSEYTGSSISIDSDILETMERENSCMERVQESIDEKEKVEENHDNEHQQTVTYQPDVEYDFDDLGAYSDHGADTLSDGSGEPYMSEDEEVNRELEKIQMADGADGDSYAESRSRSRASRTSSDHYRRPGAARGRVTATPDSTAGSRSDLISREFYVDNTAVVEEEEVAETSTDHRSGVSEKKHASTKSVAEECQNAEDTAKENENPNNPGQEEDITTITDNPGGDDCTEGVHKLPAQKEDELLTVENDLVDEDISYADDFEEVSDVEIEDDTLDLKEKDKDPDSVSIQTYVSIEHVSSTQ